MNRIRIVCKAPPKPAGVPYFIVASMDDTSVLSVGDDGTETPLTNVESIEFRVACNGEPATATLKFVDVEIDVEAEVESPLAKLRALRLDETGQRGSGRTHCMLVSASLAPFNDVIVIGLNDEHCEQLREKMVAILAKSARHDNVDRFTFATLKEERARYRGKRFGARFVDHAVVSEALRDALDAEFRTLGIEAEPTPDTLPSVR